MIAKEIRTLSKGYKQRVGLAQALIHEPPILDSGRAHERPRSEPSLGIRDLIKDIGRERTVILSTHNLAEVQVACNRVLIISKGKIVADDTPDGLQARAGKSRCVLTVLKQGDDGFAKNCEAALRNLPGVERARLIEDDAGELSYEVIPRGNDDLRPALFKAAVDKGYTLVELRREGQNLEQVFRELTTGTTAPEHQHQGRGLSRENLEDHHATHADHRETRVSRLLQQPSRIHRDLFVPAHDGVLLLEPVLLRQPRLACAACTI